MKKSTEFTLKTKKESNDDEEELHASLKLRETKKK